MEKEKNNGLIVKSNYLIEAPCKLTLTEQKIVYLVLSMIDRDDDDFKEYTFKVADFIEKLELKGQSAYSQLKAATKLLRSRYFTVRYKDNNGDNHELITGWINDADYNEDSGTITFSLSKKLKPFLLQLKEYFTVLELDNLMQMKSIYSTKIYELLKQYKKIGSRTFELEDLKKKLAIDKKSYDIYNNFKRKVLIVAKEEINEKTDIKVEFDEIKEARKVVAIKFYIQANKKARKEEENNEIIETSDVDIGQNEELEYLDELAATIEEENLIKQVEQITKGRINETSIKTLLKIANNDIEKIKEKYNLAKEAGNINDLGKWLYSAIKNNYKASNGSSSNRRSFNNFKGREYTQDEIKKMKEAMLKKSRGELD